MPKFGCFLRDVFVPVITLMTGCLVAYDHWERAVCTLPVGGVDGKALGRAYAPTLAPGLAEGWYAAAEALEQGRTVSEAQSALQSAWQAARIRAFKARVAPEFSRILPEGDEPTDPNHRAEVVRLWRDFASGLKGGR